MTVADWAAFAITLGWAATAFWVVHVITRPRDGSGRSEATKQ